MPNLVDLPLPRVVRVLSPTFRSLDLRLVTVRIGGQWTIVAGVLAATNAAEPELRRQHRTLLNERGPMKASSFALVMKVLPADELWSVLDQLSAGEILVEHRTLTLGSGARAFAPLRRYKLRGGHGALVEPELGRFPRYAFGLPTERTAEELLGDAGLEPATIGLTHWNRLNAWLGHEAIDTTGRTVANLTVALTIYAGLDNLPRLAAGNVLARVWADGRLQRGLYARGSLLRDGGDAVDTRALPIPKPAHPMGLNVFDLSVGLDRSELFPNWSVEIALFHKTLGQIGHPVHVSRPFFNPNRSVDPLTDALGRFTGGDLLGDYLRDRSGSWKQADLSPLEAGLVWLLPLLNIRAAPLLIERKAETLREGKVERGSADIIAYDMEVGLVVVDATRRLPDAHKRDQLLNTVNNLAR